MIGPLPSPRHEMFAQAVASGMSASKGYALAYSRPRDGATRACAARLLTDANVERRIAELRHEAAEQAGASLRLLIPAPRGACPSRNRCRPPEGGGRCFEKARGYVPGEAPARAMTALVYALRCAWIPRQPWRPKSNSASSHGFEREASAPAVVGPLARPTAGARARSLYRTRMTQPGSFSKQERHDSRRWLREHGHALPRISSDLP